MKDNFRKGMFAIISAYNGSKQEISFFHHDGVQSFQSAISTEPFDWLRIIVCVEAFCRYSWLEKQEVYDDSNDDCIS